MTVGDADDDVVVLRLRRSYRSRTAWNGYWRGWTRSLLAPRRLPGAGSVHRGEGRKCRAPSSWAASGSPSHRGARRD